MTPATTTPVDGVRAVYQPIVDLDSGDTVAYEALARFDPETGYPDPAAAFDAARRQGPTALARLDHACITAAVQGALEGGLPATTALFVNILPTTLRRRVPKDLQPVVAAAAGTLRIVVEVTEIHVTARPAELLAFAARNRGRGFGLAVDDVGVNPDSLALLPLLRPDVIKLDRSILASRPTVHTGRILAAVLAAAEATGAVILAEGIECERDAQVARTLGATYGQGWHFARPGPFPTQHTTPRTPLPLLGTAPDVVPRTPFDLIADERMLGRDAPYEYLLAISHDLEAKAARLDAPIVVSTFQDAERFTPATAQRYQGLTAAASIVAALATDLPCQPAPGVRGARLRADDPVRHDWNVVVLAPHFAAALIARDRTRSGPVEHRRYDYTVTHDPATVTLAAQSLLDRLVPT